MDQKLSKRYGGGGPGGAAVLSLATRSDRLNAHAGFFVSYQPDEPGFPQPLDLAIISLSKAHRDAEGCDAQ